MTTHIIFDLEATCWEDWKNMQHEIIEIGAVKLNDNLEIINRFSRFVRPTINPILSEFCTKLTSIEQKDVDAAQPFAAVMPEFEMWIESSYEPIMYSWGNYDKNQIMRECKIKKYRGRILDLLKNHASFKHQVMDAKNLTSREVNELMSKSIQMTGTHHRAIDDAENIAKFFIFYKKKGEKK